MAFMAVFCELLIPSLSKRLFNLKVFYLYPVNRFDIFLQTILLIQKKNREALLIPRAEIYFELHTKKEKTRRISRAKLVRSIYHDLSIISNMLPHKTICFYGHTPLNIPQFIEHASKKHENLKKALSKIDEYAPVISKIPPEETIPIQGKPANWYVVLIKRNRIQTHTGL
ncbi:MAG: hypothetical protein K6T65_10170 [Peptococcaceae bacterium]|nr:hypothetical protein [Peptococcaceae bacterium]